MYIQRISAPLSLTEEVRAKDQGVGGEECGVEKELNEEFERCLGDDAPDPGAEVVHLLDASRHFAAMVRTIGFPIQTCGAVGGPAVEVGYEDVFVPELGRRVFV